VFQRGQPVGVEVLDDLHEHRGVVAAQPGVGVGQAALQQPDPCPLPFGHAVEP
jgi:hypothetical protein